MKEKYEKPVINMNEYNAVDIIVTSSGLNDNGNQGGGNGDYPF